MALTPQSGSVADTYILEKRKEKKIRQGEPFCFSVVWHPLSEYISRKRAHNVLLTNAEEYNPIHHLLPYHDVLSSRVISLKLKLWREWLTSTGYSQWIIWRQKIKKKKRKDSKIWLRVKTAQVAQEGPWWKRAPYLSYRYFHSCRILCLVRSSDWSHY